MRRVIIESPYAGDVSTNLRYLRACLRDCLLRGEAPFASHGLYTQAGVLDDLVPAERDLGIKAGFEWRAVADATVVYEDIGISDGMRLGIQSAIAAGLPIEHRKLGRPWSEAPIGAAPPAEAIELAEAVARLSPCAKSQRGCVVFARRGTGMAILGEGYNGPALGKCDSSEACLTDCARRCVHAEARAIRTALRERSPADRLELVHVKIGRNGKLVPSGGPSCWQCSREVLDAGIAGVWLYEALSPASWRFYTAEDFHRITLATCGIGGPP